MPENGALCEPPTKVCRGCGQAHHAEADRARRESQRILDADCSEHLGLCGSLALRLVAGVGPLASLRKEITLADN